MVISINTDKGLSIPIQMPSRDYVYKEQLGDLELFMLQVKIKLGLMLWNQEL